MDVRLPSQPLGSRGYHAPLPFTGLPLTSGIARPRRAGEANRLQL
jgi:hypothetical protein